MTTENRYDRTDSAQALATRRAAGLFDFSFMALYEFSGIASLQGLQTRDLGAMQPGQIVYTLLLKDDGAALIDATVWRLDEQRFWPFTGKPIPASALDRSRQHAILALQGPRSGEILARLIGREAVLKLGYFRFSSLADMTVARIGFSGELGYELLLPAAEGPCLRQRLLDWGVRACSFAAADLLRIESGYVLFDREVDGRANPRELGLERLVAGKTGFPMTRKLVGVDILEGPARADAPLAALTSECTSPTLGR
ncbi:MAG: hypothetical protein ACT4P3_16965, partial [Betaproteobacteria bacterium]